MHVEFDIYSSQQLFEKAVERTQIRRVMLSTKLLLHGQLTLCKALCCDLFKVCTCTQRLLPNQRPIP